MSLFDVEKLAILATDYCVPISEGKKIGIVGNVFAAPLIQQLYKIDRSPPAQYVSVERKSEGIAAVASFVFVGLGQIYNGQIGKGIMFVILGIILVCTMLILIGFILYPIFWVYNIYDAYNTAKKINAGLIKT